MKRKVLATLLIGAMTLGLTGCSSEPKVEGDTTPVAKVNGEVITKHQLDVRVRQISSMYGFPEDDPSIAFLQETILDGLVDETLVKQEAERRGLKASSSEVKKLVDEVVKMYPSEKEFKQALEQQYKMTMDEFEQMSEDQIIFQQVIEDESKDVTAETVDAQAYYDENKASFFEDDQVKARHILISPEENEKGEVTEEAKAKAKKDAEAIIAEINGGADFSEVAKEKSDDPGSGANGGDLGFFTRERMVKPFSDAAFALKVGEMTKEPVESDFGYHIIIVDEKKEARQVPFEEVKENITQELILMEQQERFYELLDKLRVDADIEVLLTDEEEATTEEDKAEVEEQGTAEKQ